MTMAEPTEPGWYWVKLHADEPRWQPALFNGVGCGVSYGHRGPFADWVAEALVIEWGPLIRKPPDPEKLFVSAAEVRDGTKIECEYDEVRDMTTITVHGPSMREGAGKLEMETLDALVINLLRQTRELVQSIRPARILGLAPPAVAEALAELLMLEIPDGEKALCEELLRGEKRVENLSKEEICILDESDRYRYFFPQLHGGTDDD